MVRVELNKLKRGEHAPKLDLDLGIGAQLLDSDDLAGVAKFFKERKPSKIVVMCGAGISVAAGIPDFRTPGTGLYDNLQHFDLPSPQDAFDIAYFRKRPEVRVCSREKNGTMLW